MEKRLLPGNFIKIHLISVRKVQRFNWKRCNLSSLGVLSFVALLLYITFEVLI